MYVPSLDFAIEFNGMYWHSIECGTPAEYHMTKTDLCEQKNVRLLHVFEPEWMHRQMQVKNHIKIILDIGMTHVYDEHIMHISRENGQIFFENNAIAYKDLTGNCLAICSKNEIVFVAEYEIDNMTMVVKQFCFKTGLYVEDALQKICRYACNMEHVIVHRDRRIWPASNALFDKFEHHGFIGMQLMHVNKNEHCKMHYDNESLEKCLYTMYDSGIETMICKNNVQ